MILTPIAPSAAGASSPKPGTSPTVAVAVNSEKTAQDIAKVFLDYGDLVAERANLKLQSNCLERAVKRRKTEYEKSRERFPEFPSVPEAQNRFRDSQSKELKRIDELQRSHDAKYTQAAEGIAGHVLKSLPAMEMKARRKEAEAASGKDLKFECSSLKNQMVQLKDNTKVQMGQMQSQWAAKMESELSSLRKEMEAQLAESNRRQQNEFEARLARVENFWEQQAREQQQQSNAQAKASADNLATLQSQLVGLEAEKSTLVELVGNLTQELAQCKDEVNLLRGSVYDCTMTANDARSILRDVDLQGIDQIVEIFLGDWPRLQTKVAGHASSLEKLTLDFKQQQQQQQAASISERGSSKGAGPSGSSITLEQIKSGQDQMGEMWGSMLDEMNQSVSGLASRMADLEAREAKTIASAVKADTIKGPADQQVQAQQAQDFSGLSDKVMGLSNELDRKCEYWNHQFTTLDSQYNNLSTKALAEQIIAQLETFYPRNGQVVADISTLNKLLHDLTLRVDAQGAEVGTLRRTFDEITTQVENILPQPVTNGKKRRRVDATPDDHDQTAMAVVTATAATAAAAGLPSLRNGVNGGGQTPVP